MILLGILVGAIVGLLFKGNLMNLGELHLKAFWLILASFVAQLVLLASPVGKVQWVIDNGALLYILTIDLLLLGLFYNWRLGWAFRLIIFGTLLNLLVIAVNNGTIPVDLDKLSLVSGQSVAELQNQFAAHSQLTYRHLLTGSSNLSFLGDVIYIPVPLLNGNVYSLGDICISLGLAWFVGSILMGHFNAVQPQAIILNDVEKPSKIQA